MEIEASSIVGSLACVVFVAWIWKLVEYVWFRPKRMEKMLREQGLKGNSYRFWHGDLKDITRMNNEALANPINVVDDIVTYALPFYHLTITKYGKRSFVWNGPCPRLIIMDPDMVREVLQKYNIYHKGLRNPLSRLLISGIVSYEGEKWAKHRRLLNPAFHVDKLKKMLPAMVVSCKELVKKWESSISGTVGSTEVDIWPALSNMTADVISRTAFGSCYEEGKKIFELQKEQAKLTYEVLQSNYIPGWSSFPTKRNKRMKEIDNETRSIMKYTIDKREKAMKAGETKSEDLLGIMMETNFIKCANRKSSGLSLDEIIEECKLFYFAGQETTSNLLTWTMVMLSIHQDWQERARTEVFQAFRDHQPEHQVLNHLKIVNMILHEVLRLYPPGAMLLRTTHEKTKLGDLTLPAEVEIVMPVLLIHHDTELWGSDAKEFKPERFADGVANASKNPFAFMPFSSGPRVCIGLNFAMQEAKMALAMILERFAFELSPSYKHGPFPLLTLQPFYGAKIILRKI